MAYQVITRLGRRVSNYALNKAADYAYNRAKRKISSYFDTPTPKRIRSTPVSQRTHITDTQGSRASMRFTPRKSGRTLAMTNLRRRLLRTPAVVRRKRRPALYGASMSKSGGFISTTQRAKRGGRNKVNRLGVSMVIERGGVLDAGENTSSAGNTVAVGHCNAPIILVHQMLWRAIIKKLVIASGQFSNLENFEEGIGGLASGSFVRVSYSQGPDQAWVASDYSLTTTTSWNDVALYFAGLFTGASTPFNNTELIFEEIRLGSSNYADTTVNLRKAVFHFYSKSTLKVQNRTVNATGGDEESVDNVPLYGKAYFGKGSGTQAYTKDSSGYVIAGSGFHGDVATGTIAKVPTEKWYQEPVPASHFIRVLKVGKVHLDPGHIKTSVLDGRYTISLDKFYKLLRVEIAPTGPAPYTYYHDRSIMGVYRFMILEKMLNSVVGTAANSIKCAFEHNIRIGGYITTKNQTETAQLNNLVNIANEA